MNIYFLQKIKIIINYVLSIKEIDWSFSWGYTGITKCNAEVRQNEYNNSSKSSEPFKHLWNNIGHCFTWFIFSMLTKSAKAKKNLEASYL